MCTRRAAWVMTGRNVCTTENAQRVYFRFHSDYHGGADERMERKFSFLFTPVDSLIIIKFSYNHSSCMISGRFNYTTQSINAPPGTETRAAGRAAYTRAVDEEMPLSSKRDEIRP
jgi:hypothetical protein